MFAKNLKQKAILKLKNIYIKSPLNFSTITGLRYPGIPRLRGYILLGRLTTLFKENGIMENIIQASQLAEKHPSGMCYFWIGTQLSLLVTRPEDVQALKIKYDKNLSRDVPLMRKTAGSSIITDARETWQEKRAACKKFMGHEAMEQLKPTMELIINDYVSALKNYENRPFELRTFLYNLVVDLVTKNLMGCPIKSTDRNSNQVQVDKLTDLSYFLSESLDDVFQLDNIFKSMLPKFIRQLFFRNTDDIETVKDKLQEKYYQLLLAPNKSNILASQNLIKTLWDINQPKTQDNKNYHEQYIKGEGMLLLIASVATTVVTMEFIIKLLATHQEKAEKLRLEICNTIKDKGLTLDAINEMSYLEMVIKETLRLYPPAPLLMLREIDSPVEINDIPLFKGDVPIFSPYIMHRSKKYWEKPEEFIPERFSKENRNHININAYFPFSMGPRFCPGQQFAMQEMKLILITLYSNYHIDIQNNSFELTFKRGGLAAAVPPVACCRKLDNPISLSLR